MLFVINRYSKELIEEYPDTWFVFGDNFDRVGNGGQAKACRPCSNVIGIPTKENCGMDNSSFLFDKDFHKWYDKTKQDFRFLRYLTRYSDVVFPRDGVGTGLADLKRTSPMIFEYIEKQFHDIIWNYFALRGLQKEKTSHWSLLLPEFPV